MVTASLLEQLADLPKCRETARPRLPRRVQNPNTPPDRSNTRRCTRSGSRRRSRPIARPYEVHLQRIPRVRPRDLHLRRIGRQLIAGA